MWGFNISKQFGHFGLEEIAPKISFSTFVGGITVWKIFFHSVENTRKKFP